LNLRPSWVLRSFTVNSSDTCTQPPTFSFMFAAVSAYDAVGILNVVESRFRAVRSPRRPVFRARRRISPSRPENFSAPFREFLRAVRNRLPPGAFYLFTHTFFAFNSFDIKLLLWDLDSKGMDKKNNGWRFWHSWIASHGAYPHVRPKKRRKIYQNERIRTTMKLLGFFGVI
jgi:hypothetical protein